MSTGYSGCQLGRRSVAVYVRGLHVTTLAVLTAHSQRWGNSGKVGNVVLFPCLLLVFDTGSHHVTQAGFTLIIPLPHLPSPEIPGLVHHAGVTEQKWWMAPCDLSKWKLKHPSYIYFDTASKVILTATDNEIWLASSATWWLEQFWN